MAEKNQQIYPLAPANYAPRSDQEYSATLQSEELRKKKRLKCFAYIAAFVVFQTIIIVVFALTVMRIKTPKVRFGTVVVDNGIINGAKRLSVQVTVKNTNFGRYKFDSSVATVTYRGASIGQFVIPEGRAGARSTKKFYIMVDVDTSSTGSNSGVLEVSSQATLNGKVELMKVLKKRKKAEMSCTMSINLSTNAVQGLECK